MEKKKTTQKKTTPARSNGKHPGGRPSKFIDEYIEQAEKLCRLGAVDMDLADFFGVTLTTIQNWKIDHPKFFESIKSGKDKFDIERVEGALIHRALGYDHEEDKVFCSGGEIITERVQKHYPPDSTALIFFLKNRQPERWRDRREMDLSSQDGTMSPTQQAREQARMRIMEEYE